MQDFSQWVPSVDMGKVMLLVGRMLRTKRPDAGDTIEVPGTKLEVRRREHIFRAEDLLKMY